MNNSVMIKGIREGLLVQVGDSDWTQAREDLLLEIGEQGDFLAGAKLVLEVNKHEIGAAELGKLRDDIEEQGISLWAVLSQAEKTLASAQSLGLATRIHRNNGVESDKSDSNWGGNSEAAFIEKTIRSGDKVQFPGNVTIFGDVNPGAEIVAGGHVIVWGKLRGLVHAGADGDEKAKVCALDLSPTQLRIADQIAVPPEGKENPTPEIAFLHDGKLESEPWQAANNLI
jgi:septum site-determining protein MinC